MMKHLKTDARIGINLATTGHGAHWTYDGQEGPKSRGSLSDDYAVCKTGKEHRLLAPPMQHRLVATQNTH